MLGRLTALVTVACAVTGCTGTAALAQDSTVSPSASRTISDTTQHVSDLRSPTTAAVLGTIVPGAGLLYAGQWRQGIGTYFTTVSAIGLGTVLLIVDSCGINFTSPCKPGPVWPLRTLGVAGIALGLGTWAYGAVDAVRIVKRNNARKLAGRDAVFGSIEPTVIAPGAPGAPWAVGIHATW